MAIMNAHAVCFTFLLYINRLTESGLTQGLHKTKAVNRTMLSSVTASSLLDGNDEEKETLIASKESSHEYD